MMQCIWLIALVVTTIKCEPPVNSYLPPSGISGRPSSEYGPPGAGRGQSRSSNRQGGTPQIQPSDEYLPPGQSGQLNSLNTEYGTPTDFGSSINPQRGVGSSLQSRGNSGNGPSSQYGVPFEAGQSRGNGGNSQNSQLGAPNQGGQSRGNSGNVPNSQYGTPNKGGLGSARSPGQSSFGNKKSGGNGNGLKTSYGPPSRGTSGTGIGFSTNPGPQRPESSYGPPATGFGYDDSGSGVGGQESSYSTQNAGGGQGRFSGGISQTAPSPSYGAPGVGGNSGSGDGAGRAGYDGDDYDEPVKYEFSYDVDNVETGTKFGHSEQRDGDLATGEYNVLLPDGRKQVVEYEAGLQGYKPQIRYEGNGRGAAGSLNAVGGSQRNINQGYSPGELRNNDFNKGLEDNIGYPGSPEQGDRYQQAGGFEKGGLEKGYSRGEQGSGQSFSRGQFGQSLSGTEGGRDLPSSQDSQGYPRGGQGGQQQQNQGYSGSQSGQGYSRDRGGQSSEGYPSGRPGHNGFGFQGSDNNGFESLGNGNQGFQDPRQRSAGYPRDNPRDRGSKGGRDFSNGSQVGRGRNGDEDGYPTGGPNGPRGSGY